MKYWKSMEQILCFMITFPSTLDFEDDAEDIMARVKKLGTRLCDGANMNAFMGIVNLKVVWTRVI